MRPYIIQPGGDLRLKLHPGQLEAFDSQKRFVFVLAGTQGGKTSFGPLWILNEIRNCGEGDYIVATSTFKLFKLKLLPEILNLFCNSLEIGRYWRGDHVIELRENLTGKFWAKRSDDPMWGRIILTSAQQKGGIESATAKAAWLDEVGMDIFGLDQWDAVQRRVSIAQGRILGTTTLYNRGWLKQQIYDRWKLGDPEIEVIQFDSMMNPAFPKAEFERMRARAPEWKFNMFYRGKFDIPAGLIYGVFEDERDAIDPKTVDMNQAFPRHLGADFGPVHFGMLHLMTRPGPNGPEYVVYDEYLQGNKDIKDHVAYHKNQVAGTNFQGGYGGIKAEEQWRREFNLWGGDLALPAVTDYEVGIDIVYGVMKNHRLKVTKNCRRLLSEIGEYSRELDPNDEPTAKVKDKSKYHLLDCLRAVLSSIAKFDYEEASGITVKGGVAKTEEREV